MEPMDMPIGRFAGIIDPQGAPFAVMQMPANSG
jgi:predicted enzyme related to lactoylglutathione lyase